jgi:hypothetical protein
MFDLVWYLAVLAAVAYLGNVALAWWDYGSRHGDAQLEPLLDRYLPDWEVAEHHEILVDAPTQFAYAAARGLDFESSPVVRAIFRLRQLVMRSKETADTGSRELVERMVRLGWGILVDLPGRAVVMGAVTQPWRRSPVFQPLSASEFTAFNRIGYAKIAWSIRVEPDGPHRSVASTETRVAITDQVSRARFRWYWAFLSPGILLIRRVMLHRLKRDAERQSSARADSIERPRAANVGIARHSSIGRPHWPDRC